MSATLKPECAYPGSGTSIVALNFSQRVSEHASELAQDIRPHRHYKRKSKGASLLVALLLGGCIAKEPEILGTPVMGYNHTSAAINRFTVNGAGGPNLGPYGGGGGQVCCGAIPRVWRPGLSATVEWVKDPNAGDSKNWPPFGTEGWRQAYKRHAAKYTRHTATVEIPRYERAGPLIVHFLPCNQVRVTASNFSPRHPNYPYQLPRKMVGDNCLRDIANPQSNP